MSSTLTTSPPPTDAVAVERVTDTGLGVTSSRVLRSEWRKFFSVRSNVLGVLAAVAVGIGFGWIFSSGAGTADARGPSSGGPLEVSLAGFNLGQIILGVFGVLTVTTEYSTGLIRTTFAAVGRRIPVLRAKVLTYGLVSLAAMTVAVFAAFLGGQALYAGSAKSLSLFDTGVLRSVLGQVLYLTGIGVIGVALGFIVRSAAAAIGILFSSLLLAPALVGLLPSSISDPVLKFLPSNAGAAFTSITRTSEMFSPAVGLMVFVAWVAGLVLLAGVLVSRRDA